MSLPPRGRERRFGPGVGRENRAAHRELSTPAARDATRLLVLFLALPAMVAAAFGG